MMIYRMFIRSVIDCGGMAYGTATGAGWVGG